MLCLSTTITTRSWRTPLIALGGVLLMVIALVCYVLLNRTAPTADQPSLPPYELLNATLENIYLAFAQSSETAIYDALAEVTSDEVLTDLYLQRRQSLVERNFSDETVDIHGVDLIDMNMTREADRLNFNARWYVVGQVGHDEHQHVRGNAYHARLSMAPVDGQYKVTRFELLDVTRIEDDEASAP